MIEFRLLWKEHVPQVGLQTFAGAPTTDFQTVRKEFVTCRAALDRHLPFIELREPSSHPWHAPDDASIPSDRFRNVQPKEAI